MSSGRQGRRTQEAWGGMGDARTFWILRLRSATLGYAQNDLGEGGGGPGWSCGDVGGKQIPRATLRNDKQRRCGMNTRTCPVSPLRVMPDRCQRILFSALDARHIREAVGVLEGNHPAGVLGRQGADLVEPLDLVFCELNIHGREILLKLIDPLSPDDD